MLSMLRLSFEHVNRFAYLNFSECVHLLSLFIRT